MYVVEIFIEFIKKRGKRYWRGRCFYFDTKYCFWSIVIHKTCTFVGINFHHIVEFQRPWVQISMKTLFLEYFTIRVPRCCTIWVFRFVCSVHTRVVVLMKGWNRIVENLARKILNFEIVLTWLGIPRCILSLGVYYLSLHSSRIRIHRHTLVYFICYVDPHILTDTYT